MRMERFATIRSDRKVTIERTQSGNITGSYLFILGISMETEIE